MITLTGTGELALAYQKQSHKDNVCVYSFRKMSDDEIGQILSKTDVLIHNSAGLKNEDAQDNWQLTKRIVLLVLKNNPSLKFVNIGSMSYLNESGYKPIKEMSSYAYTKFLSEIYCIATLPVVKSIRFSSIFYCNPKRDGLSQLISNAVYEHKMTLLNGGSDKRDWIPLYLAVKYIDTVINEQTDKCVNVASGIPTSFLQAAKIIQKYSLSQINFKLIQTNQILSKFEKTIDVNLENEISHYIQYLKST